LAGKIEREGETTRKRARERVRGKEQRDRRGER